MLCVTWQIIMMKIISNSCSTQLVCLNACSNYSAATEWQKGSKKTNYYYFWNCISNRIFYFCSPALPLSIVGIVCNITASTSSNCNIMVEKGIIAPTAALLNSPHSVVVLAAVYILTNVIQDKLHNRVIVQGAITPLLKLIQPNSCVWNQRYLTFHFYLGINHLIVFFSRWSWWKKWLYYSNLYATITLQPIWLKRGKFCLDWGN